MELDVVEVMVLDAVTWCQVYTFALTIQPQAKIQLRLFLSFFSIRSKKFLKKQFGIFSFLVRPIDLSLTLILDPFPLFFDQPVCFWADLCDTLCPLITRPGFGGRGSRPGVEIQSFVKRL